MWLNLAPSPPPSSLWLCSGCRRCRQWVPTWLLVNISRELGAHINLIVCCLLICKTSHPLHVLVTSVGLNSHYLPWECFLLSWAWKGHLMSCKVFFVVVEFHFDFHLRSTLHSRLILIILFKTRTRAGQKIRRLVVSISAQPLHVMPREQVLKSSSGKWRESSFQMKKILSVVTAGPGWLWWGSTGTWPKGSEWQIDVDKENYCTML